MSYREFLSDSHFPNGAHDHVTATKAHDTVGLTRMVEERSLWEQANPNRVVDVVTYRERIAVDTPKQPHDVVQ